MSRVGISPLSGFVAAGKLLVDVVGYAIANPPYICADFQALLLLTKMCITMRAELGNQ